MSLTPFTGHNYSLSSVTLPPDGKDGKDGKQPPVASQAIPRAELPPPPPASSDTMPLRDRVRKRGEQESEDAAAFHPKRAKAALKASTNAAKLRKDTKLTGPALEMDATQPVTEWRRLLGLDRLPVSSSASSSSSSPASGAVASDFEPTHHALALAQTLRKTYIEPAGRRGSTKLLDALDAIVPSLRGVPLAALKESALAIGALAYTDTVRKGFAERLLGWCRELGPQGAPFARALIGKAGVSITKTKTWADELAMKSVNASTAQVWEAVIVPVVATGASAPLNELIQKMMGDALFSRSAFFISNVHRPEVIQQFFHSLGKVCLEYSVSADRLCAMLRPYVVNKDNQPYFAAFCDGLGAQGMEPQHYDALVGLWLAPGAADELTARQFVMGASLAKFRPPQDFVEFATSVHTQLSDFREYKSFLMGHFTHLLEAAKRHPQRLDTLARVWSRELAGLLDTFNFHERAELIRGVSLALREVNQPGAYHAFFEALVLQLLLGERLGPGSEGEALLSAALECPRPDLSHPFNPLTAGYFNVLARLMIHLTPAQVHALARLGSRSIGSLTFGCAGRTAASHALLDALVAPAGVAPAEVTAALVGGFVSGLPHTDDLQDRLAQFFNGLGHNLTARDEVAAGAIGRGLAWGLGGVAASARGVEACITALMPRLRLLPATGVTAFLTGLVAGLGGPDMPPELVRQLAQAFHDTRAAAVEAPHPHDELAETTLRQQLSTQRFDQAVADAARAPDFPIAQAGPGPGAPDFDARMAAWRSGMAHLGAPPAIRSPLPIVDAHDREAARLWLGLAALGQALRTEAAGSEQPPLQAELDAGLTRLQAHLPPASRLTPEDVEKHLKTFQRQRVAGLTPAMQMHDALALGWRLGLDQAPAGPQDAAAAAVRQRTQRLLQLAAPPATGAGADPLLIGLVQAAARPRQAPSAQTSRVVALLRAACNEVNVDPRGKSRSEKQALMSRIATTTEWILRSLSSFGPRAELAEAVTEKLWRETWWRPYDDEPSATHPAQGMSISQSATVDPLEALVGCVVRGLDAHYDVSVLEPLLRTIHATEVASRRGSESALARYLAHPLARAIGRGEPLQSALRIAATRSFTSPDLILGLCDHPACPADVLFKAARNFTPAQKVALLGKSLASTQWQSMATYLAAPPPPGHPHNRGGEALTTVETYEWVMALGVAYRHAYPKAGLSDLRDAIKSAKPLPGNPLAAMTPTSKAQDARIKANALEALDFVAWPNNMIRELTRRDMTADRRLVWLKILYENATMTEDFAQTQLLLLASLPAQPEQDQDALLHIGSIATLFHAAADQLGTGPLRSARKFMLDQLRDIQQEIAELQDGHPDMDHTVRYLRASEALTGLYTPDIYGRASGIAWAFQAPAANAPRADKNAFQAKARGQMEKIQRALRGLGWEITRSEERLTREKARYDSAASLLKLSTELAAAQPAPAQAPDWKKTLDAAALELRRASLLPQTLEAMLVRMKHLLGTLQSVVTLAGIESAPAGPGPR